MDSAIVNPPAPAPTLSADNPWPGLAAFGEQDRAYFFGRDEEAEELYRLVMRERFTVLFGQSGLGKSSLLQAGLFPRLRSENLFPVYIRLDFTPAAPDFFAQITGAIAVAAAAADIEAPPVGTATTLWEYFHRRDADFWNRRNRPMMPVLVFDQFEEIFTLGRADLARSAAIGTLIEQIADAAEGRPPAAVKAWLDAHPTDATTFVFGRHHYKILLTIREDFLADLEGLRRRISAVALNRYRLRRMNGEAALMVVEQAPHLIDRAVATQVVRFVGAGRPGVALSELDVEPALLSVVCRELNEKRRRLGEPKISPELLEGSQEDVLSGFYETSVEDLPTGARAFIEERLLTVSGYRDSVALENALETPDLTRAVIDRLVERRLVRIEDRGGVPRLELTHDLLTRVIRASRDRRRAGEAAERERFARQEAQARERRAVAELRRTRRIGMAFLALAIVAVAASVVSFLAQREAARQERSARAAVARAAVQDAARHVKGGRRDLALAHLAFALRSDPESVTAQGWATDLLRRSWWLPGDAIRHDMKIVAAAMTPAGMRLVGTSEGTLNIIDGATGKALGESVRFADRDPAVSFVDGGQHVSIRAGQNVWWLDTTTGRQVGHFTTEDTIGPVRDGQRVLVIQHAAGSWKIRLWDAATGKPIGLIDEELTVWDMTNDGRRVLTWSNAERLARVRDTATGAPVGDPINPGDIISDAAKFSPDGRRLITGFRPDKARLWDSETGKPVGEELNHGAFVGIVSFSPDSRLVLTASRVDGSVQLWDVETGRTPCDQSLPAMQINSIHWSSDGRRLLIRSATDAQVWDTERCVPVGEPLRHDVPLEAAAISADGGRLLTASDGIARSWDLYNALPPSPNPVSYGQPVGYSRDGRRVLMISELPGGSLDSQLWDVDTEARVGESFQEVPVSFVASGRRVMTQTNAGTFRLRDVQTGARVGSEISFESLYSQFSDDGRRLLDTPDQDKVTLWDLESATPIGVPFPGLREGALHVGPGNRVVRVSGDGRALRIWDAETATQVGEAIAIEGRIQSLEFSSDGRRALVVLDGAPARLLDMSTGKLVAEPLPHQGPITFAGFTPDDRLALIAVADGTVQFVNAADGAPIRRGFHQPTPVRLAVTSRDGRLVIATDQELTRLWDTVTGTLVGEPLSDFIHDKCTPGFSQDERLLLVPTSSRTAGVFEAASGRALGEPVPVNGACPVFADDGRHVITAGADGAVNVLEILPAGGSEDEATRLADSAEAIGGYRVNAMGSLEVLTDRQRRLAEWRRIVSQPAGEERAGNSPIRRIDSGVLPRARQ